MRIQTPLTVLAALALVGVGASSASAAVPPDRLQPHTYTCDFAGTGDCVRPTDGAYSRWVTFAANGDDSPLDSNARALVVHTPSSDQSAYDYTEVYTNHSRHINRLAANVRNLAFDAYKPALQGGSPRIVVFFTNPLTDGSTYVAIDAGGCSQPLSSTWVRADATGRTLAGCTITTSGGTQYTSDGANTAWQKLLAANSGAVVAFTFMVFDQPTGQTGVNYRVDRIALGTGKTYRYGNAPVNCTTEAAC